MKKIGIIFGIILLAALSRLIPHPANFTPITAMALMSGAYLGRKSLGFLVPMGALFLSDCLLGFYPGMIFNYLGMALVVLLGSQFCKNLGFSSVAWSTLASSLVFFVVSNFGVWVATEMYPKTWTGLINCYAAAIPFFGNALLGDFTYSLVIFTVTKLVISNKIEVVS